MKNKLKRLQLAIRNLNRRGFLFGAAFVLTFQGLILFGPKMGTYADPAEPEIIISANADVMSPFANALPSFDATPSDDSKYTTVVSSWNLEEGDYHELATDEAFEVGKPYTVRIVFTANDGYAFDNNTTFTINSGDTSSYGTLGDRQRTFYETPEGMQEEMFDITYDFNGGTAGGDGTISEQSGSYGMYLTEENLIDRFGVEAPAGKVLNYITINDEPFNVGDGFFLDRNIVIKYYWRDDTDELFTISFDANGGTLLDYDVPEAVPAGQTFVLNAPDETQVTPPDDKIFDAFEINGQRYNGGVVYTITQNSTFKLLWKDIEKVYYKVSFNTGTVFPEEYKLVDQYVEEGQSVAEPENAAGEKLSSIVTEYDGKYYYDDYELIGFYLEPSYDTLYNGQAITQNTVLYARWYDTISEYEQQISEVDLTVTPPVAGTEITMEDEEDWDSQEPELEVTLPEDVDYEFWVDHEDENYSYWVKEKSFYSDPFVGTLEKGGKYYAEIWLRTKDADTIAFARDVVVKVNGTALAADAISYDIDSIVVLVEVEIEDDTAAPNTGDYASEGGSVVAMSSAMMFVVMSGLMVWSFEKRRR